MFFGHDGGDTSQWRLKGHAEKEFWKWVASWAVMIRKPSDLGYSDDGFILPELEIIQHTVKIEGAMDGYLVPVEARTLTERRLARKGSLSDRVRLCADLVNSSKEQWLIWCDLNAEGDQLEKSIRNAMQIAGKHDDETKETRMHGFINGQYRVLVSKASICGFGMNLQNAHNIAFVGLSDSYEQFYQAVRRCWRFGQKHPVKCHIITGELEGAVVNNIQRKEKDSQAMTDEMVKHMQVHNIEGLKGLSKESTEYTNGCKMIIPSWIKQRENN
jgi:superfamily II DNA/RNA helicase